MAPIAARLPVREISFAVGLLLLAGISSWASGRSMLLPEIFRPGLGAIAATFSAVQGGAGYFQNVDQLQKQNAALQAQVASLQQQLSQHVEAEKEATRLEALMGLQSHIPQHGRAAEVIGHSPDNWHARVYLDKGSADGVQIDGVVLAPQGVVGKIIKVGPHTSEAALLTDPGNQVSCLDQRSRSPGVVAGEGESTLVMKYLQQQVDFRVGDALVTSGYGGVYPKGLPLGTVSAVNRQPNAITPDVSVVPDADLDRLEEVMILDALPSPLQ